MSDSTETSTRFDIPDPWSLPLAEINPLDYRLFHTDRHWGYFERLRAEDPVHLNVTEQNGRYWNVTKFDDCVYVDRHHELFSAAQGIVMVDPNRGPALDDAPPATDAALPADSQSFIAMDPPRHDQQRAAVSPALAPRNLALMEDTIRERVGHILDGLPVGETFNWVDEVAIELTTQMLATLFDFPFEERHLLPYWTEVILADGGPGRISRNERRAELARCLDYFNRLWEERAAAPPANDFISMLAHSEDTRHMSQAEYFGNLMLLITGGNDTTRNTISGGVLALNRFPAEYDKLRADPGLIASLVPEIIRWQTPVLHIRRVATRDVELRGKTIRKGDQVVMWYVSGNRDDEVIDRPDDFIIDRPRARHHLSFGFGIHRCMGNRLAEMQVRILWEEILKRFHAIEVVAEPVRNYSVLVRGYIELPVRVVPL